MFRTDFSPDSPIYCRDDSYVAQVLVHLSTSHFKPPAPIGESQPPQPHREDSIGKNVRRDGCNSPAALRSLPRFNSLQTP